MVADHPLEEAVTVEVIKQFEGVHFELLGFTLNLNPPKSLVDAISAKADEVEKTKKIEETLNRELAQIEVDLKKAEARVRIAELKKQENILLDQGLTDKILMDKWITAWGKNGSPVPQIIGDSKMTGMYTYPIKK